MMKRNTVIAVILFLSLRGAAAGDEPPPEILIWRACVEEAKRNNPDLCAALAVIGQSRANRTIKASPLFPQINSEMRDQRARGTDGTIANSHQMRLAGQQLFFDGFKTPFNIEQADEEISSSRYNYAVTSSQVRLRL
ncbi:MAG: TolC family protein, partial [Candidatus Aureabacteria bacterium]|nr:TolC family protein [Candidatus Auribacterota bacterium]